MSFVFIPKGSEGSLSQQEFLGDNLTWFIWFNLCSFAAIRG
jgi:hypothetical protein